MEIIEAYDRLLSIQSWAAVLSLNASKLSHGVETGIFGYQEANDMYRSLAKGVSQLAAEVVKYQKEGGMGFVEDSQARPTQELLNDLGYTFEHLKEVIEKRSFQR
jgi:hypothetical protein